MSPTGPAIALHPVCSEAEVARWRGGFAAAYVEIFAAPPYLEAYDEEEAGALWDYLTSRPGHITIVAADADRLVGFGIAIPLTATRKVAAALAGLVPEKHTWYLAEMGVVAACRGRGLGRVLIQERLKRMDPDRTSHVVLRVPVGESRSAEIYRALGFEEMGVTMDVQTRRIDGTVRSDRRMFMSRVLSQVDVE